MMVARRSQQLELTWYNKDRALIPTEHGKYGYTWVHPTDPRYCESRRLIIDDEHTGQQAPKQPRKHYSERADHPPQTENLLIHGESGDILEALTRVPELKAKYAGQVQCIYIDPPFNTGELTFGNYDDNLEHSIWLTMMRDRLTHMHTLLADTGSIWVHLDDNENHRMRVLLDEIFGPANFIGEVVWQKTDSTRNDFPRLSGDHDSIIAYRKSSKWTMNRLPRPDSLNDRFTSPDGDPQPWWDADPTAPSARRNQTWVYAIQHPVTGALVYPSQGRCWFAEPSTIMAAMSEYAEYERRDISDTTERARIAGVEPSDVRPGVQAMMLVNSVADSAASAMKRIHAGNLPQVVIRGGGTGGFGRKSRIPTTGIVPSTWWPNTEVGHNREAKAEIKKLFPGGNPFATPKPERLLERILHISSNPGDLILDVFAGSGTTAAVAHKMGRRWITCELISDTIEKYTLPRLLKVINGADDNGVTKTKGTPVLPDGAELPNNMTVTEAAKLTSLLIKATKGTDRWESDPTLDELKALVKTKRTPTLINWRGGGGFRTAHLSPACFDYDPELGIVTLTKAAEDIDTLIGAVAAHRGFRLTPGEYFHGLSGTNRLLVTRTPVDAEFVTAVAAHLAYGEQMTIASTVVLDGARAAARKARRGSRILHIPHDMFTVTEDDT